jgi:hypothetical protein
VLVGFTRKKISLSSIVKKRVEYGHHSQCSQVLQRSIESALSQMSQLKYVYTTYERYVCTSAYVTYNQQSHDL